MLLPLYHPRKLTESTLSQSPPTKPTSALFPSRPQLRPLARAVTPTSLAPTIRSPPTYPSHVVYISTLAQVATKNFLLSFGGKRFGHLFFIGF
ncbi:hypothetical protein PanWU01x14_235500 [Parasponia andersonii]|uniref:Uncharacterized protein n=1 Tax=Parasponia andersonii TaxID=3476 RepID=A0A2P5BIS9_PARAD|nr:hypothetical protein PanWU01x14_235500 [Parasponia andersonii]